MTNERQLNSPVSRNPESTTAARAAYYEGADTVEKKAAQAGVGNTRKPVDQYPRFIPAPAEKVVAEHGNCYIVQGTDRIGRMTTVLKSGTRLMTPKEIGYGTDGHDGAYMIDLVVGRNSYYNVDAADGKEIAVSRPNFDADAARIYISQKTDIDKALGIRVGAGVGQSVGRSGIAIKADAIRLVGREGIKIVTGVGVQESGKNARGGNIGSIKGIDLIAGNLTSNPHDLQPIPKGINLLNCLKEMLMSLKFSVQLSEQLIKDMEKTQQAVDAHIHNSPFFGAPTSPSVPLQANSIQTKIGFEKAKLIIQMIKGQIKLVEMDYLDSAMSNYINSQHNNTN